MNSQQPMTYAGSGVNYDDLDPFKRAAMEAAAQTTHFMEALGFKEIAWSRGESAYLFEHIHSGLTLAFVVEGLGTKNLVAENPELRMRYGRTFYDHIQRCNMAMVFNDMITVGAMPLVSAMHPAVESGSHLSGDNGRDLIQGSLTAAIDAKCTMGPGETPALRDIIVPGTMCLSGAAIGVVRQPSHLMSQLDVKNRQEIILLGSSGIHANGLTLARKIAAKLPDGYLTRMGDSTFGEILLTPTQLYVECVRLCQDRQIPITYGVNITGHGWRKLMRSSQLIDYIIKEIPPIPPIFAFMMENGPVELREMYANYNMGAGFALFVDNHQGQDVLDVAASLEIPAWNAGWTEVGTRRVIIKPLNLEFTAKELDLR